MTPELEKELKALRLRANFDPKRRGLEGPRVSSINQSPTAQQFPMSNLVLIHTIHTDLMWRSFFETRTGNPRPFQGDTHPAEPSLESHASQVPVLGFGTRPQGSNLSTFGSKLGQGFSVGFPTGQGGSRKQFSGSGSFRFVWFPFRGPSHFCLALGQWDSVEREPSPEVLQGQRPAGVAQVLHHCHGGGMPRLMRGGLPRTVDLCGWLKNRPNGVYPQMSFFRVRFLGCRRL